MDPRRYTTRHFPKMAPFWRAVIEISFIVFLFYSNLLMGQYVANASPQNMSLWMAIKNIVTPDNFIIALVTALIGHLAFEFLRKRI
ncbi:MAG: hypothetical protein ABSE62_07140 [Chthoniobacteraceae bacterium]|jgi:hypothetical protein